MTEDQRFERLRETIKTWPEIGLLFVAIVTTIPQIILALGRVGEVVDAEIQRRKRP